MESVDGSTRPYNGRGRYGRAGTGRRFGRTFLRYWFRYRLFRDYLRAALFHQRGGPSAGHRVLNQGFDRMDNLFDRPGLVSGCGPGLRRNLDLYLGRHQVAVPVLLQMAVSSVTRNGCRTLIPPVRGSRSVNRIHRKVRTRSLPGHRSCSTIVTGDGSYRALFGDLIPGGKLAIFDYPMRGGGSCRSRSTILFRGRAVSSFLPGVCLLCLLCQKGRFLVFPRTWVQ